MRRSGSLPAARALGTSHERDYTCSMKKPRTNSAQAFRGYAQKDELPVAFVQAV